MNFGESIACLFNTGGGGGREELRHLKGRVRVIFLVLLTTLGYLLQTADEFELFVADV